LEEKEIGCARPTGALVGEPEPAPEEKAEPAKKEVQGMTKEGPGFRGPRLPQGQVRQRQAVRFAWKVGSALLLPR